VLLLVACGGSVTNEPNDSASNATSTSTTASASSSSSAASGGGATVSSSSGTGGDGGAGSEPNCYDGVFAGNAWGASEVGWNFFALAMCPGTWGEPFGVGMPTGYIAEQADGTPILRIEACTEGPSPNYPWLLIETSLTAVGTTTDAAVSVSLSSSDTYGDASDVEFNISVFADVYGMIAGAFEATLVPDAGGEPQYVWGDFGVCRVPDRPVL
jgi:hypothetical protein